MLYKQSSSRRLQKIISGYILIHYGLEEGMVYEVCSSSVLESKEFFSVSSFLFLRGSKCDSLLFLATWKQKQKKKKNQPRGLPTNWSSNYTVSKGILTYCEYKVKRIRWPWKCSFITKLEWKEIENFAHLLPKIHVAWWEELKKLDFN